MCVLTQGSASYRPPPARVLELGCARALVGLLSAAGYQATGLDLSPAITGYVSTTFKVPVLTGPLESHRLPSGSVDVLVMMDVLEHLPDPVATLIEAGRVLAPDGLIVVQTPNYPPAVTHQSMVASRDAFLDQLKADEHLFLLSQGAVREMLSRAGFAYVEFEPAIFAHYDQFLFASRQPMVRPADALEALRRSPGGRIVEALLDTTERADALDAVKLELQQRMEFIENDRAARLEVIQQQQRRIDDIENDRAARLKVILDRREKMAEMQAVEQALSADVARLQLVEAKHSALVQRLGPLARLFGRGLREGEELTTPGRDAP